MSLQPVLNSLIQIVTQILDFIPRLVNGLIILIVGYLISALIRWLLRFIFRRVHLDQLMDRAGITNTMRSLGIRASISEILAQIIFFFLLLSFATSAFSLMGLTTVSNLLQNILQFIPKAISAAILVILGSMLARFLGNTITAVADNVNITYGKALGKIIEYAIVAFVMVLAVSTLGIDTTILTTSFTIIVAAAGLAIALTFAFGSRESARNVIAGHYVRQNFRPGQRITLGDYSGTVRSTAGAYTVLDTANAAGENSTISLPNTMLIENAVMGQEGNVSAQPASETTKTEETGEQAGGENE
ncbi:MAG: mechanosensitive ion channel family protein [Ktedonobacteraceae bacterium]